MPGQIIKRGDRSWLVRVFLGRDGQGRRRYLNKTIHGTRRDAERYLHATLCARDMGTLVKPTASKVDEFLQGWLTDIAQSRVCQRTYISYSRLINSYAQPSIGHLKLADLQPLDLQRLYGQLLKRGLSPRTVRYLHAVLHSAFKQAVRWRLIAANPCDAVELPRQERRQIAVFTPEEARRFLDAARDDRWYALFVVALTTGARPSEYLALRWSDVDLERRVVTIQRAVWRHGGSYQFSETKTARSRRRVPLPPSAVEALRQHRLRQHEQRLKAGPAYTDLDLVFAGETGEPLDISALRRRHFMPILRRAGLPPMRLYDLRHACATLLLSEGVHPKVVAERLGHASTQMTLDVYSHVLPHMQEEATATLERRLFALGTL